MTEPQVRGIDRNEAAEGFDFDAMAAAAFAEHREPHDDCRAPIMHRVIGLAEEAARAGGRREAELTDDQWFTAADRLTAIIEARMSKDLAWLDDDGKTIIRLNPEEAAHHIAHLYRTGDVVSGLPPLREVESER